MEKPILGAANSTYSTAVASQIQWPLRLRRGLPTIFLYIKKIGELWFGTALDGRRGFGTSFAGDQNETLESLLRGLPPDLSFDYSSQSSSFSEEVFSVINKICSGESVSQDFYLAFEYFSDYVQKVLYATSLIPVGYVTSYGSVANAVGGSARAVGKVMSKNPFPPIVPCHRVVKSDFTLGGYGGGLAVKIEFLIREKRSFNSSREIFFNDKVLAVFPVEYVLRKLGIE